MSWRKNADGEWYWPLHPNRPEDHLRVWRFPKDDQIVWRGALVLDGEYLGVCETHLHPNAEQAKEEVFVVASFYLGVLGGSLAPQLSAPDGVTLAPGLVRLAARIAEAKRLAGSLQLQLGIDSQVSTANLSELCELVLAMGFP